MSVSRRCFLKFFGGATTGMIVSPLPWKLLDDVSIWTQNGCWVAETPRGPVSYIFTTCTLCHAGCGLRLRRVGDQTVSAWAVADHPLSGGRICPAGLGVAQIPFHPARIRGAAGRGASATEPWRLLETNAATEKAALVLARLRSKNDLGRFAILDLRPGRSLSVMYDDFLAEAGGGHYLTLPTGRDQAAAVWGEMMETAGTVPGIDLEKAGAVISFGAPIFDGWMGGGPASGLRPEKSPSDRNRPLRVIQVQTNGSMNTGLADTWLPIKPGTEAALALGLAHIFRYEMPNLFCRVPAEIDSGFQSSFGELLDRHSPEKIAKTTGIEPHVLRATAWDLSRHGPVVAVGGGNPGGGPLGRSEELALWILNLTLGCLTGTGPVQVVQDLPEILQESRQFPAESLRDIPDGSLDLLLIDGSLPGTLVPRGLLRRKMRGRDALIVGMSAYVAGPTAEADIVIPTSAPGEWVDDLPPRALAPRSAYALVSATEKGPAWALHPADLLGTLADAAGLDSRRRFNKSRHEEIINGRVASLQLRAKGVVFDPRNGTNRDVSDFASPKELKKVLSRGGCWVDQRSQTTTGSLSFRTEGAAPLMTELSAVASGRLPSRGESSRAFPLVLMLEGPPIVSNGGVLPPVVNKLYRESNLLPGSNTARINPATARNLRVGHGREAFLETRHGKMKVTMALDEKVRPGVIVMSPAPDPENLGDPASGRGDILQLCGACESSVRRVERAALQAV